MKKEKEFEKGEVIIYKPKKGAVELEVKLEHETVWLSQKQMADLFDKDIKTVNEHIRNVYSEGELKTDATIRKFQIVQKEGKREVSREIEHYNLDVIISVGYRVKSLRGTQFRIWATNTLRQYLIQGYALNQKRIGGLKENQLAEFEDAVGLIKKTIETKQLSSPEESGLLKVITEYANSWILLQKYDEKDLKIPSVTKGRFLLDFDFAISAIGKLKSNLLKKKEATDIFGLERQDSLRAVLGNINQTFGGKELYVSIEDKAAHLLYFLIKDHPFTDGNKRIGSFLFIVFLAQNRFLLKKNGEKKINDNTLVALALLVAESNPKQKDLMIRLIMNFLVG